MAQPFGAAEPSPPAYGAPGFGPGPAPLAPLVAPAPFVAPAPAPLLGGPIAPPAGRAVAATMADVPMSPQDGGMPGGAAPYGMAGPGAYGGPAGPAPGVAPAIGAPPPGRNATKGGLSMAAIGAIAFLVIGGGVTTVFVVRSRMDSSDKPIPTVDVPAPAAVAGEPGQHGSDEIQLRGLAPC